MATLQKLSSQKMINGQLQKNWELSSQLLCSPWAKEEDEEPDPGEHQTDDHVRQSENEPRTEVDARVSTVQPSQTTNIDLHDGILEDEKGRDVTFWGSLCEANDHVTEKRHQSCMGYPATGYQSCSCRTSRQRLGVNRIGSCNLELCLQGRLWITISSTTYMISQRRLAPVFNYLAAKEFVHISTYMIFFHLTCAWVCWL